MTAPRGGSEGKLDLVLELDNRLSEAEAADVRGDPSACVAACQALLRLSPEHPKGLLLLGNSLGQLGRASEAVAPLEAAVRLMPGNANAHYALGMALTAHRRWEGAADAYRRVLALAPRHAFAYNNLGVVLRESGMLVLAIATFREALAIDPGFRDAAGNLVHALLEVGRTADALPLVESLSAAAPKDTALKLLLAQVLRKLGRAEDAIKLLDEILRHNPRHGEARYALGHAQKEAGHHEAALTSFSVPGLTGANKARFAGAAGTTLMELGRLVDAREAFEAAVEAEPAQTAAWLHLAGLRDFNPDDPALATMERVLATNELPERNCAELHFALGKALENAGHIDRAFKHYQAGNAIVRVREGSEIESVRATHAALRRRFADVQPTVIEPSSEQLPIPIFIVGMPRSGTTLVEQILASHPEVEGAGELKLLEVETLAEVVPYPDGLGGLDAGGIAAIATRYRSGLARLAPNARFATDKMPVNYEKLGLIAEAFPSSPIIHLRRDPLDSCFSCYTTFFSRGQKFSYDLEELGTYYRLYDALMDHWGKVISPDRLLEVHYEALVADPAPQVRRLLDHCGLAWSDNCLAFHQQERTVRTASVAQVRRPLYSSSVGRWRRFERHLMPLIRALEA